MNVFAREFIGVGLEVVINLILIHNPAIPMACNILGKSNRYG
jgi:hypothetical protein